MSMTRSRELTMRLDDEERRGERRWTLDQLIQFLIAIRLRLRIRDSPYPVRSSRATILRMGSGYGEDDEQEQETHSILSILVPVFDCLLFGATSCVFKQQQTSKPF